MSELLHEVLVCYDVSNDKTRKKLRNRLKDLGLEPVQLSVMWGFISMAEERAVRQTFQEMLKKGEDKAFLARSNLVGRGPEVVFGYEKEEFSEPKPYEVV